MDYETVNYEVGDGIVTLTLDRPRRYNAVNHRMMVELEHFWRERVLDLDAKVVLLRGNGPKGFCSGLDVLETAKATAHAGAAEFYRNQARMSRVILAMRNAPQPIVAAIHGAAAGLGLSFALAADIRVISPSAKFCAAYINIGLGGADMACSYLLPKLIGAGRAHELMLMGNMLSAEEAVQLGLTSKLVPEEDLLATAYRMAKAIAAKDAFALRMTKEAINVNLGAAGLEAALQLEDRNQAMLVVARAMASRSTAGAPGTPSTTAEARGIEGTNVDG